MRKADLAAILMLAGMAGVSFPEAGQRERDKQPRRFTDMRKAEAVAKRERKAAKRRLLNSKEA